MITTPSQQDTDRAGRFNHRVLIRVGLSNEVERFQAIDKAARSRYAALPGFELAAQTPAIAAERFDVGEVWAAEVDQVVVGFALLQPHEDTVYLANISVLPEASGAGVGAALIAHAFSRGTATTAKAVTLATFRTPPWNGPWFRRQGFEPIPEDRIGPMLRAVLERHARYLDMSMREELWHRT
jgi:N-acetylglutamate synthase-like GNAT family acetyltransferase